MEPTKEEATDPPSGQGNSSTPGGKMKKRKPVEVEPPSEFEAEMKMQRAGNETVGERNKEAVLVAGDEAACEIETEDERKVVGSGLPSCRLGNAPPSKDGRKEVATPPPAGAATSPKQVDSDATVKEEELGVSPNAAKDSPNPALPPPRKLPDEQSSLTMALNVDEREEAELVSSLQMEHPSTKTKGRAADLAKASRSTERKPAKKMAMKMDFDATRSSCACRVTPPELESPWEGEMKQRAAVDSDWPLGCPRMNSSPPRRSSQPEKEAVGSPREKLAPKNSPEGGEGGGQRRLFPLLDRAGDIEEEGVFGWRGSLPQEP
ncbi:unnamed protein product [Linum trigynum]|uniref:Uncharacterized protein n=1 Tax=Linum trigynum TaxID=586398 RepID=A0AAV2DAQ8_9ROSI